MTVRARLTLLFTGLSATCGVIIVAVSYTLVAQLGSGQTSAAPQESSTFARQCKAAGRLSSPDSTLIKKCAAYYTNQGAQGQRDLTLSHLLEYSLVTLLVVVALAAILGWIVAGRALRPVHQITAAARAASEDNLSARVTLRGPRDELRELAETFNDMLDRLRAAFESQRRFIANASHELRTPLAVMRTSVDVVVADPTSTSDDLRRMAVDIRTAVDHAEHLIEALLILARNDRGLTVREDVDLATIAEDVLEPAHVGDRRVHTQLDSAVVSGNPVLIEHLIANLVDNAFRYSDDGGEIWVGTGLEHGSARLTVSNTGPIIDAQDIDRIFQPFQRLNSRTSHEGFGLGLTIVGSIAANHGGSATAVPRDGGGLSVTVTIPSPSEPSFPGS